MADSLITDSAVISAIDGELVPLNNARYAPRDDSVDVPILGFVAAVGSPVGDDALSRYGVKLTPNVRHDVGWGQVRIPPGMTQAKIVMECCSLGTTSGNFRARFSSINSLGVTTDDIIPANAFAAIQSIALATQYEVVTVEMQTGAVVTPGELVNIYGTFDRANAADTLEADVLILSVRVVRTNP